MMCKERIESYLQAHSIPFEQQHHRPAYTAQDVAASEHISGTIMAKVVIVFADSKMTMLVLPAANRVDVVRLGEALGARDVTLAGEREIAAAFPDCEVGAMPPFGNLYNIPVYVDERLTTDDQIVFQAGTHTETISMAYADYARLVNPIVRPFAREARVVGGTYW